MFFEHFYVHKKEGKVEIIVNKKGSVGEYNNFRFLPHPYIAVQKKNKWGVINYMTNKENIPFKYMSFSPIKHHTGYHPLIYNKQSQSFILLAQIDQKTCHVINQQGEILADSINYEQSILDINWGDDTIMIRQGTGILFISVDQLGVHSKFHDYKY